MSQSSDYRPWDCPHLMKCESQAVCELLRLANVFVDEGVLTLARIAELETELAEFRAFIDWLPGGWNDFADWKEDNDE
jgi:hypothetical protein